MQVLARLQEWGQLSILPPYSNMQVIYMIIAETPIALLFWTLIVSCLQCNLLYSFSDLFPTVDLERIAGLFILHVNLMEGRVKY